MPSLTETPFARVFACDTSLIPVPFRRQFLHTPETPERVRLEGEMEHIWHRPKWLKPLFWLMAKGGVLVSRMGEHIPTVMDVGAFRGSDGLPYHTWFRTIYFPRPEKFNTTLVYEPSIDRIADFVGPGNAIQLYWQAQFHQPATFTLDTAAAAIGVGGRRIWLPRWLWRWMFGVVRFRQIALPDAEDTVSIELIISHPLFGDVFGYRGKYRVNAYTQQD
jgi:hypothetical protein